MIADYGWMGEEEERSTVYYIWVRPKLCPFTSINVVIADRTKGVFHVLIDF